MAAFTHFTDNLMFSIVTGCKVYPGIPVESISIERNLPPAFGDFALTNKDNKSMFSFRFPSECHIDFKCL